MNSNYVFFVILITKYKNVILFHHPHRYNVPIKLVFRYASFFFKSTLRIFKPNFKRSLNKWARNFFTTGKKQSKYNQFFPCLKLNQSKKFPNHNVQTLSLGELSGVGNREAFQRTKFLARRLLNTEGVWLLWPKQPAEKVK